MDPEKTAKGFGRDWLEVRSRRITKSQDQIWSTSAGRCRSASIGSEAKLKFVNGFTTWLSIIFFI